MTGLAAGLGLIAVFVALPALAGHHRGVSPRVSAAAHLVSLVGWGLLPAVWLACLGGSLGSWLAGIRVPGSGCLPGLGHGQWQLLGYLPAAAALAVLGYHMVRAAAAGRRAEMRGPALAGSVRRVMRAGEVWIFPSARPAAFAAGLWRPRAVVSSGLLAHLEETERQAVCEHEAAHIRLGHPRLLLLAGAVAAAYGRLGPVRRAWDGLRRELEAAADDEAVRLAGADALLSALLRVALMARGTAPDGSAAGFGDPGHLRYRIARLEHPCPVAIWPTVLVALTIALAGTAMAVAGCLLTGVPASVLGVAACLGGSGPVCLRPAWMWLRVR